METKGQKEEKFEPAEVDREQERLKHNFSMQVRNRIFTRRMMGRVCVGGGGGGVIKETL